MIQIQRLGHATLETPDLRKTLDYFVGLNGFVIAYEDKACAHLASKLGQLTLTLERSERADCSRLSFEVAPGSDFKAGSVSTDVRKDEMADEGLFPILIVLAAEEGLVRPFVAVGHPTHLALDNTHRVPFETVNSLLLYRIVTLYPARGTAKDGGTGRGSR